MMKSTTTQRLKMLGAAAVLVYLSSAAILTWDGLHDRPGKADLMLVLGNALNPDGTPADRLRSRLDRAVEFDRQEPAKMILVSGGMEKNSYDEADAMANYLADQGVSRDRIALDHEGRTTYDSAKNTAALLKANGWHGVVIVTQYFHIPRTRLALERWGVSPVFSVHVRRIDFRDLYSLGREASGWVTYHFKRY